MHRSTPVAQVQEVSVGGAERPIVHADGVEGLAQLAQMDLMVAGDAAELVRDSLPQRVARVHGGGRAPRKQCRRVRGCKVRAVRVAPAILPSRDGVVVDTTDEIRRAVDVQAAVVDLDMRRGLVRLLGQINLVQRGWAGVHGEGVGQSGRVSTGL